MVFFKKVKLSDISMDSNDEEASSRRNNDAKNASRGKTGKGSADGGWTGWFSNGDKNSAKDPARLVKEINSKKDYYAVLGVEKNCSVDDVKKAYRKLSLKVHPDKNKASGAEEAFKKISVAFKCLSDVESRKQYDRVGLADESGHHRQKNPFERNRQNPFEHDQENPFEHDQEVPLRRRRRTWNDYFKDDVDPEELYRQFFGNRGSYQSFRNAQFNRTRMNHAPDPGPDPVYQMKKARNGVPNSVLWLPLLILILFAFSSFMVPEYSLSRGISHQIRKTTENYGVDYFVKSYQFDTKYPIGSPGRIDIENNVINEYKLKLGHACYRETSWLPPHRWDSAPKPHCEILESFAA